ncbi:MAG: hypothetical protein KA419_19895 [Acidobacteria bacterium]|nr:hypothetical protein [Acidobacteriota bacterium]
MVRRQSNPAVPRSFALSACVVFLFIPAVLGSAPGSSGNPGPAMLSGPSWMYDSRSVIGNRQLTDIAIPGTHDSGTYGITGTSAVANDGKGVSKVISWIDNVESHWYYRILDEFGVLLAVKAAATDITSWWAKVQRRNFSTQLADGIRYFDLRVEQSGQNYYCVHSLHGANLQDLISGIQAFYANPASSHEILLLDFQHTFAMNHAGFVAYLKNVLRDGAGNSLIIPRGANLCLNKLWATKGRIVVFYDDDATVAANPELWSSSSSPSHPQIYSPWPNTNDSKVLYDALSGPLADWVDTARKSGYFIVLQSLATEGFSNVASSVQAHVYYLFRYVPILGLILKRLGYDQASPMNFFDFNFGGFVLADFLDNPGARNLAVHRANVIIIDDYANFVYNKGGGGTGGYLDLIDELNTGRAAASPKGPYHGVVTRQTANFTADHYQVYPVEIDVVNTGSVAWDPAVVFLGTAGPYNRTTHLYTSDGWVSQTRIRMQNTAAVQPGETAVFKFSIMPDDSYATSYQSFELVADASCQGYPAQWFGNAYGNTALYIQTTPLHYGSKLKSQGGNTALASFDTTTLSATFTNTGNIPWFPDTVFLGDNSWDQQWAAFYAPDGDWESKTRIRMRNTSSVMPGQDAVFTFGATAGLQALGGACTLQLVADKAAGLAPPQWFGSQGNVTWNIALTSVTQPGVLTGQLVSKSPDCTLTRGQSQAMQLVFRNTGVITWYPDLVFLQSQGDAGGLYTDDGNWFSPVYIVMQGNQPVPPGGEATFSFEATPNADIPSGSKTFQLVLDVPFVWGANVAGAAGSIYVTVRGAVPFATPSVWVANYEDGTVTRLDSSTGAVLGTCGVGKWPAGVAVDASGNAWVTNMGSGTVSKLNGSTGGLMGTYPVGSFPTGIAVDPSGNVWVANQAGGSITKLNGATGATLGTYAIGGSPNGVAVDPSGDVWVTDNGPYSNIVSRLRGATGAVVGTSTVGDSPFGIAVDASGHVWVSNGVSNTVSKLDRVTGATLATYPVGTSPGGIAVDAADDVWVTSGSNTVTRIRGSDGSVVGTYPAGSGPFGVSVDAAGNLWVTDSIGDTVTRLNGLDGSLIGSCNVGQSPASLGDMTGFALKYLVLGRTLSIITGSLAAGYAGYNYDETAFAAGGTPPYTWAIASGSLPAGLSFSGGRIFGTPSQPGTCGFTLQVTDGESASVTHDYSLVVNPTGSSLAAIPSDRPPGTVGDYYWSNAVQTTGGTAPYTWSLVRGAFPDGIDLNPNGSFSGIPTSLVDALFRIRVVDGSGEAAELDVFIGVGPGSGLSVSTADLPDGSRGVYYQSAPLAATGGLAPYAWRIASGSLPEGLYLNPDGVISGVPAEPGGSRLFTVEAADSLGSSAFRQLHIWVDVNSGKILGYP